MTDRTAMVFGALVGALVGAGASYLFFTEAGRSTRDRLEPAIDDLVREFQKFRGTLTKVGDMANDGIRAFNEFQQARQTDFPGGRTSH